MLRKPLGCPKRSSVVVVAVAARLARPWAVRANTAAGDMGVVMQAECDDVTFPSSAVTTSAEVVQHSPEALLNTANQPLLVPLMVLLYRRGALNNSRTRQEIVRFMVPAVHRDALPWLWENGAESGDAAAERDVSGLRSLPPHVWRITIERIKPAGAGDQLHHWHQVFFALASNPAFAETATFDSAHQELLGVLHDYYSDVMQIQRFLPPLEAGTVVTRLPPVLVRKLRKLYVERGRWMQYAEFFRLAVDGEERVMPICGTAMLNDAEVFEYYLTIPGRRDSGIERERRWPRTVEYAVFAFQKLFRQRVWRGTSVAAVVSRPAALFMNVCVFARNDHAEGERYREAILAVMRAFHAQCVIDGCDGSGGESYVALLRILRDAGLESIIAKCKRLHFGPMRGLLDMCTVATVVEMALSGKSNGETGSFSHAELEVLLSSRKNIGNEMYDSTRGHICHRIAARYGLLNLGTWVSAALQEVLKSSPSMRRQSLELARWGSLIGWPLRLDLRDVSLASLPSLLSSSSSPPPPLLLLQQQQQQQRVDGDLFLSWKCGCQCLNNSRMEVASCIGCVSREMVEHQWTCPHCSWVSTSGDRIDTCLGCNRPHPRQLALAQRGATDSAINRELSAPLLWYCERCSSFSPISCDEATTTHSCMECGAMDSGWPTGFFEWRCGCGEVNNPLRRWCSVCSVRQKHASCTCGTCGKEWKLHPRGGTAAAATILMFEDKCPSCMDPHPRDAAARRRRLLRCPFCHHLTPGDDVVCQNCQHTIGVLRQFLALESDWPWLCHVCGRRHHHRDTDSALRPQRSLQLQRDASTDTCIGCGAIRIHPVMFHSHETWSCTRCGGCTASGFNCSRCFSLHPSIPATEVHAWRCVVCLSVNSSWESTCQRSGCGTWRSNDSTILPYTPWRCSRCGKFSRSTQVPQCEHCSSVRTVAASLPTSKRTTEEQRTLRLAQVEMLLEKAAAADGEGDVDMPERTCGGARADDWSHFFAYTTQLAIPLT